MSEYVGVPGATRTLMPQAVVLLDPANGTPYAAGGASEDTLAALSAKVPAALTPGLLPVDALGTFGASRNVAMGAASANVALSATCRRVSMRATVTGFFAVGVGAQTASTNSHYIGEGERLDLAVPAGAQIAALCKDTVGTLYISELA